MDLRVLSEVTVLDTEGAERRLSEQWADRPAVIAWLRHYGCMFCIEQTQELRQAQPRIKALGGHLVLVGNGGTAAARAFQQRHAPDVTVLTDPALRSYRAVGARSGVLNTVGPASWGAGLRALKSGARQTSVKGHPFQQGAVMVIAPGDRVLFSHISRRAGDHPDTDAVLRALEDQGTSADRLQRAG